MTPRQAADIIGCSHGQVCNLIRSGTLAAKKTLIAGGGYCYNISRQEAQRYRNKEQTGGWPRGQNRV